MERVDRVKSVGGRSPRVQSAVQLVDQSLRKFDKRSFRLQSAAKLAPVGRVEVFHNVDAIGGSAWLKKPERIGHVAHAMAPIVQHNVWRPKLLKYFGEKRKVGLAPDAERDLILLELLALRINVDAHNLSVRSELALPHLCGAASSGADFEK